MTKLILVIAVSGILTGCAPGFFDGTGTALQQIGASFERMGAAGTAHQRSLEQNYQWLEPIGPRYLIIPPMQPTIQPTPLRQPLGCVTQRSGNTSYTNCW